MSAPLSCALPERRTLTVTGPDAATFLQGLVSNDVRKAAPGAAVYAALLTPQGKYLHDFFIAADGAGGFVLDTGPRADDLLRRLAFYRLRAKVEIAPASLRVFAVWGDGSAAALDGPGLRFPDPRLPALGVRVLAAETPALPGDAADASAYNAHRIALGVPGDADLTPEDTFLLDANFDLLHGVDFKKGCYVGQEITARMKHRGSNRKRTLPLVFDGPPPAPGTPVTAGDKAIGSVLSGVPGRTLAVLRTDKLAEATTLSAGGVPVSVDRPAWFSEGGL